MRTGTPRFDAPHSRNQTEAREGALVVQVRPPAAVDNSLLVSWPPQHLAQEFDFLLKHRIAATQFLDPAAGMQDSCVIAVSEPPADIGQ